uniref:Uncharacterized protein n=1 Tax=Tanacetum cinerariifolium TaxID=118510 RepID=A0A6L2NNF6_TANCI|nr:hypothetical protein [Tanacetum cinerariifolium]
MQLKYEIRKLSREHKVREDKLEINKMVFHAMSQALTETEALLCKRAKSNVGVASVEGESGDIETDELSFPKRQDVSSQGNRFTPSKSRPPPPKFSNYNWLQRAHQAESSKLVNSLEELTKQQQIQQQQDLIVQGMKTLQQSQLKINQSMKDVKCGVTSIPTKLSDTQTQFAAKVTSLEKVALKMHCSLQGLGFTKNKELGEEVPMTEGEINQRGESMVEGVMVEENEDKRESESVAVPNSTIEEVPTKEESKQPKETKEHNVDTEADQQPKETKVENVQAESALILEKEVVEGEGISVLETAVTSQTQADPSQKDPTQTNSSSNEYFSIKRDSVQDQAVLQAVGLRKHEVVVQRGKEKTLLEAEEELLKSKYAEERRIEDIKGAIAARLLHEEKLKKRKEELDRIAGIAEADEEMIKKMKFSKEDEPSKSKKKGRKGPSKPSNKKKASSMRVIQAEKQKPEEFLKRRAFPDKILRVQLKKRSKSKIVTGDLLKRFGKMKELGIDTTGLPQPITPKDEVDKEDVEVGPVLRKKKFTMLDMDRIVDAAHVLTKMKKVGYDEIMDSLNLEMPQGVINPQIGMCVEEPEHGLIIQTHKGVLGLQRSVELHRVSNIHLYALRQSSILLKNPNLNLNLNFNLQLQQVMESYQYEEMDDQTNENTEMENIENRDSNNTEKVKILDRNKHQINPFNKFQKRENGNKKRAPEAKQDYSKLTVEEKKALAGKEGEVLDDTEDHFWALMKIKKMDPIDQKNIDVTVKEKFCIEKNEKFYEISMVKVKNVLNNIDESVDDVNRAFALLAMHSVICPPKRSLFQQNGKHDGKSKTRNIGGSVFFLQLCLMRKLDEGLDLLAIDEGKIQEFSLKWEQNYSHLSASIGYSQPLVNKILRNTVDFRNILKDKKRPVTMESLLVNADVVQEENAGAATGSTGDDVAGAATESTGDGVQVGDAIADEVTRGRGENAGAATGSTRDDVAGAATGSMGDGVQVEDAVADVVNRGRRRKRKRKKGQAEDANNHFVEHITIRPTPLLFYLLMSLFPHLREHSLLYHHPPPILLSPPSAGERLARCMAPSAHSSPPPVPSPLLPSCGCPTQVQTLRIASTQALIDAVTAALPSPPLLPLPPSLYIPPHVDHSDDIPEPIGGRGIDYGFVGTVDAEPRQQGISEVRYGIMDTWVDPAEAVLKAAPMTAERSILRSQSLLSSMSVTRRTCMLYWRMLRMATHQKLQTHRDHVYAHETHIQAHQAQLQLQSTLIQTQHQVHETRFHMQQTEMAELRDTDRRRKAQMVEMLRVMRDMRREMSDMQTELLAHREQQRRARQPTYMNFVDGAEMH